MTQQGSCQPTTSYSAKKQLDADKRAHFLLAQRQAFWETTEAASASWAHHDPTVAMETPAVQNGKQLGFLEVGAAVGRETASEESRAVLEQQVSDWAGRWRPEPFWAASWRMELLWNSCLYSIVFPCCCRLSTASQPGNKQIKLKTYNDVIS